MFSLSSIRAFLGFGGAVPAPAPVVPAAPPVPSTSGDRGIRNNNPGNIDRDGTPWEGLAADQAGDPRFCVFTTAEYGIRALAMTLLAYQDEDGCKTIRAMINRWAPPQENDSLAYVNFVAGRMGIAADAVFDIHDPTLCALMTEAIIAQENGDYAYPVATVNAGLALAGIAAPARNV